MMKRIFILLFLSLALLGCATRYHSSEYFVTGYTDEATPGKLKKVIFSANEFTSKEQVEIFTLFRCAQLGKKLEKPYFSLYASLADAVENKKSSHPAFSTIFDKYTGYAYVLYKTEQEPDDFSTEAVFSRYEYAVSRNRLEGALQ